MSILVVGAGIIGLRTAVKLRHAGYSVVLYAKDFPKDSTSNGAGGFWMPYQSEPAHLVDKWAEQTLSYFFELHEKGDSVVEYMKCAKAINTGGKPPLLPSWANCLNGKLNFQVVDTATFGLTIPGADKFWSWDGFVIDCPRYLDRMLEQLSDDDNVKVKLGQPGFSSIKQVVEYAKGLDCIGVVNCIGRGAAEVCDDNSVTPARGALVHYNRPSSVKMVVTNENPPLASDEEPSYVIPRGNVVVCGGTYLEGDLNDKVTPEESERIKQCAEVLCPQLAEIQPISTWVGFRPARGAGIRFETERVNGLTVLHNYGHGGSGWTVFEGSTEESVALLMQEIQRSKY